MDIRLWRILSAVLLVVGLLVSGVMLVRTLALLTEHNTRTWDVCSALFGANCDDTLLAATSWQFGIPWAGWGLVVYFVLACLLVLGHVLRDGFEIEATLAALLVALSAAAVSVVLLANMLHGDSPVCPLCVAVHAVNLALIPVLKLQSGCSVAELSRRLRSGGRYLLGRPSAARDDVEGRGVPGSGARRRDGVSMGPGGVRPAKSGGPNACDARDGDPRL